QADLPPKSAMVNIRLDSGPNGRTGGRLTTAFAEQLRQQVHAIAPQLLITDLTPMTAMVDRTVTTDRLLATLSAAFGLLAIGLGGFAVCGGMSTAVARRAREMAIRMALGAAPARVVRLVVGDAMQTVIIGIAIGLLAAWQLAGVVNRFLVGVTLTDPL